MEMILGIIDSLLSFTPMVGSESDESDENDENDERKTLAQYKAEVLQMMLLPASSGGFGIPDIGDAKIQLKLMKLYTCDELLSREVWPGDVTTACFDFMSYWFLYGKFGKLDDLPQKYDYRLPRPEFTSKSLTYLSGVLYTPDGQGIHGQAIPEGY
ncbi:hypothetical protein QBC47DRAFT_414950 [Echria macrotheca]|uniref:Uncharacterized protein n=1 Tax=Echria macrotheca TaxID=438768 RepID=A0AAJ0F523_9PEZI|nr:hypothetical protein QBC47DRAFT_414950 [Echria macrotheca]